MSSHLARIDSAVRLPRIRLERVSALWVRAPAVLWIAAITAATAPLAFNPWGYNAFELPKSHVVRALVLAAYMTALWLRLGRSSGKRLSPLPRTIQLMIGLAVAFGASLVLATILSVNLRHSLQGSYWRQNGLGFQVAMPAFFVIVVLTLRGKDQAMLLWRAMVWGSTPVVAYALIQAAGLDPFTWQSDSALPVFSTLGRSNFLGAYLALMIPLTAGLYRLSSRRWPYAILAAGQVFALIMTGARAAWVGLAFGALVIVLLRIGRAGREARVRRRAVLTVIFLIVVCVAASLLLTMAVVESGMLPGLPLNQVSTWVDVSTGSTAARLAIWRTVAGLVAERPLTGYGPETLQTVFERVYPPQLVYYQGRSVDIDRAHNLWLDLAMTGGVVSASLYALLVATVLAIVARRYWRAQDEWQRAVTAAACAALVAHVVGLHFSFDVVGTAVPFWLTLALAVASQGTYRKMNQPVRGNLLASGLAVAGLSLFLALSLCLRPLWADIAFARSQQPTQFSDRRLAAAATAARLRPAEPEYRHAYGRLLMAHGALDAAEEELSAAIHSLPLASRYWVTLGDLHALRAAQQPAAEESALRAYARAIELAPTVATNHVSLGRYLQRRGLLDEAARALERAVELDATQVHAYQILATVYAQQTRAADAAEASRAAAYWEARTARDEAANGAVRSTIVTFISNRR